MRRANDICVRHIRLLPKPRQVYDLIAHRAKNVMTQQLYNRYVPVQLLHAFSLLCKAGRILRLLIAQTGERRLNANRERHSFNACLCAELIQGKEEEEGGVGGADGVAFSGIRLRS